MTGASVPHAPGGARFIFPSLQELSRATIPAACESSMLHVPSPQHRVSVNSAPQHPGEFIFPTMIGNGTAVTSQLVEGPCLALTFLMTTSLNPICNSKSCALHSQLRIRKARAAEVGLTTQLSISPTRIRPTSAYDHPAFDSCRAHPRQLFMQNHCVGTTLSRPRKPIKPESSS